MRARRWSMCAGLISAAVACAGAAPAPAVNPMIPPALPPVAVQIRGPDGAPLAPDVAAIGEIRDALPAERQPGPDVARWVEGLHSLDFRVRDAATINLMQLDVSREAEVRFALSHEKDDEAAARLLKAAIHLQMKLRTPTQGAVGLLGISLWTEPMRLNSHSDLIGTVVVTEVQPGFPAEEFLKAGDRIVTLDGEGFLPDVSLDYFKSRIMGSTPGRPLHLTFVRNGRMMKADVPLVAAPQTEPLMQYIEERRGLVDSLAAAFLPAAHPPLRLPDPDHVQSDSMEFSSQPAILMLGNGRVIIGPGQMVVPNGNGGVMIMPRPVLPPAQPPQVDDNNP